MNYFDHIINENKKSVSKDQLRDKLKTLTRQREDLASEIQNSEVYRTRRELTKDVLIDTSKQYFTEKGFEVATSSDNGFIKVNITHEAFSICIKSKVSEDIVELLISNKAKCNYIISIKESTETEYTYKGHTTLNDNELVFYGKANLDSIDYLQNEIELIQEDIRVLQEKLDNAEKIMPVYEVKELDLENLEFTDPESVFESIAVDFEKLDKKF